MEVVRDKIVGYVGLYGFMPKVCESDTISDHHVGPIVRRNVGGLWEYLCVECECNIDPSEDK